MTDILSSKISKLKKRIRKTNKFVNNLDERLIMVEESLRNIRSSVADYTDGTSDDSYVPPVYSR